MATINLTDLINSNYPAFNGGTIPNAVNITNTASATSSTSGALIVAGGAGIQGSLYAAHVYANNQKLNAPTINQATLDFGTHPGSNEASVTITGQTNILSTSQVTVYVSATDTSTSHSAADHRYLPLFAKFSVSTPSAGTGFTIYARSEQKLTGTWTIRWSWI